jgi:transcriptional regulator of arginine metabolism
LPSEFRDDDDQLAAVAELLRTMQPAGPNLLVVRTAIGAAQRVALAFDRCNWPEVIGNIGGDDTVFVATESGTAQRNLITRIEHSTRS